MDGWDDVGTVPRVHRHLSSGIRNNTFFVHSNHIFCRPTAQNVFYLCVLCDDIVLCVSNEFSKFRILRLKSTRSEGSPSCINWVQCFDGRILAHDVYDSSFAT
eukprot:PhF_6_TR29201/c0_g1_i1/m.42724